MKFYLALFALAGFASADNCGSAPLGSLGRRLDLNDSDHNNSWRSHSTGRGQVTDQTRFGASGRTGGSSMFPQTHQTGQNGPSNQASRGTTYSCFPAPRQSIQFIPAQPKVFVQPKIVTISLNQNPIPTRVAPVSQTYVQTSFFPTVDFYPWGNSQTRFTSTPSAPQTSVPTTTPPTSTTQPTTPQVPVPLPEPIPTQTNPTPIVPTLPVEQPTVILPPTPVIPSPPADQSFIPLDNTYLFNQENQNQDLNLSEIQTQVEPTFVSTDLPVDPVTATLPTQPTPLDATPLVISEPIAPTDTPTQTTVSTDLPDFSQFDFSNLDLDNLDALLNAPPPAPITPAPTAETTTP